MSLGLDNCYSIAKLEELINREIQENANILRYHASKDWLEQYEEQHRLLRRDVEEEPPISEYDFKRYVSTLRYALYKSQIRKYPRFLRLI